MTIGGQEVDGPWLPAGEGAGRLLVRVYFYDWERERPPRFELRRVGSEGEAPAPLDPDTVVARLDAAISDVETRPRGWPARLHAFLSEAATNSVRAPAPLPGGGLRIHYGGGLFELEAGEALVVAVTPPRARYWSFQLYSLPWFEPVDVGHRQTSLNGRQVHVDADGRVRVVVAHRDPGVPNWLDAAGLEGGALLYRWIWSGDAPAPSASVVGLDVLRDHLPPETPHVGPGARRAQLDRRRTHLAYRFRV